MGLCFLIPAFILPRLTLHVIGAMPLNSTSFGMDVVLGLLAPRLLIAFWMHEAEFHPLWVGLFILAEIAAWAHHTRSKTQSKSKKN